MRTNAPSRHEWTTWQLADKMKHIEVFLARLCAGVQTALFLDMALKRCCDAFFQVRAYAYNRVEQMNDFMGHLPMSYRPTLCRVLTQLYEDPC